MYRPRPQYIRVSHAAGDVTGSPLNICAFGPKGAHWCPARALQGVARMAET